MNLQQLQMDLQATNIELSKTYEYLQNYNTFVMAGKATVPLEVARENYLKLAAVKSSIEQAIAATMAQLQNANNLAAQPANTGLSSRQPMLNNGNDGYSSNNTNVATSLHSDAKPKQEPTQQNSAPMATKHNVTYRHINYIKEKNVTIENNKCFATSTRNTIDIKIIKDRPFNLSPLYLPSEENVCYIAPVKGIIVQDGSNTLSRLVDIPFNVATFASPRSIDSAEFVIYNHIRELMKISIGLATEGRYVDSSELADIKTIIETTDLKTNNLNWYSDTFKDTKIVKLSEEENNENVNNLYKFLPGGRHIYYTSSELDYNYLMETITSDYYNEDYFITDETYLTLFNVIKVYGEKHGILEFKNGLKFRYYDCKNVIKLTRCD